MLYHPADSTGSEAKHTDPPSYVNDNNSDENNGDSTTQTTKLVISHVDVRVTPEELMALFSTKGRVSSLALMEDKYVCPFALP
jgi:hypothetical protein